VARLPIEFQIITLRDAIKRNSRISAEPAVYKWMQKNAEEFSPVVSNKAA